MDEVEIVNYDPRWPTLFDQEAKRLRATLDPSLIVGLEHFGSTAVPGLSAKPIIDILIAVRSLADAQVGFVEALRNLDYVYWADNPKQDRMFFVRGMPPFGSKRSHHVHVPEAHGEMWQRLASETICALIQRKLGFTSSSKSDLPPNTGGIARLIYLHRKCDAKGNQVAMSVGGTLRSRFKFACDDRPIAWSRVGWPLRPWRPASAPPAAYR
jgi:GrpB-like predicted nucleotidyltransferase (UPF0157 family)